MSKTAGFFGVWGSMGMAVSVAFAAVAAAGGAASFPLPAEVEDTACRGCCHQQHGEDRSSVGSQEV